MGRFVQRPFGTLLLSLGALIAGYPVLDGTASSRVMYDTFLTVVFLAAFRVVFGHRRHRALAIGLGLPTLVGTWVGPVHPAATVGFHLVATLFLFLTVGTIVWTVYQQAEVSADGVAGALRGYLLIAVAFGHLYCLIEAVAPGSFHAGGNPGHLPTGNRTHFVLTYFSFATLTTVGYGDLTPATGPARGAAIVEAVTGQFYLAVLIADLVGKRVGHAIARRPPQSDHR